MSNHVQAMTKHYPTEVSENMCVKESMSNQAMVCIIKVVQKFV